LIKSRLQAYLPFIQPFLKDETSSKPKAVDLGCGRGEWLEILAAQSFHAVGIDIDEDMLEECRSLDLEVFEIDALKYLEKQKENSFSVISGFHFAEHISFETLRSVIGQALRVLKAGGLLILETPNPENVVVGTVNFYMDPTHQRPLPPLLLSFTAAFAGFDRVKILRLQDKEGLLESDKISILNVLSGVSPDYSIIAQKKASKIITDKFDSAFSKEYGVTLDKIAKLYDRQIKSKLESLELARHQQQTRAEELAKSLESALEKGVAAAAEKAQLTTELEATKVKIQTLYASKWWRITRPLRKVSQFLKQG